MIINERFFLILKIVLFPLFYNIILNMKKWQYIIILIILLLGLIIIVYPYFSNFLNEKNQSRAVSDYKSTINTLSEDDNKKYFVAANMYNQQLFSLKNQLQDYKEIQGYEDLLNINSNGMMGYLTIDKINVKIPIYHGTSESVMSVACGHVQGTSLPVGGTNTHSVISAHCGLPTARLFTDLNKLNEGDRFTIIVLNREITYEIDNIIIVKPYESDNILIKSGKDYCTLLTCTPYGINTSRLLVRGIRIN